MQVEVRFYGFVRDIMRNAVLSLEIPAGSTLRDLFNESIKECGEALRQRLFTESGELETNVQVFIGGHQSASLENRLADAEGEPEVKVFVLSATAGG